MVNKLHYTINYGKQLHPTINYVSSKQIMSY